MSGRKKIFLSFLGALVMMLIGYGAYLGYSVFRFTAQISAPAVSASVQNDPQNEEPRELRAPTPKENLNILLVGVDSGKFKNNSYRADAGRTDTIMIFSINRESKKVSLLSVPRDTYVDIPGRGMDKVNHAYAFGGVDLSIKTLTQFLGVPIHHYVKVDYQTFVKIVDGLGGVTVDVTEDVTSYSDGKVKVPKGAQKLDGQTAFEYVQIRQGDITRVERQQKFVKTLAGQALSISSIPKIPGILNNIAPNIRTDMSPKEMLDLALEIRSMDAGNMTNKIVPGRADMIKGVSYWLPDESGTKEIVQGLFR